MSTPKYLDLYDRSDPNWPSSALGQGYTWVTLDSQTSEDIRAYYAEDAKEAYEEIARCEDHLNRIGYREWQSKKGGEVTVPSAIRLGISRRWKGHLHSRRSIERKKLVVTLAFIVLGAVAGACAAAVIGPQSFVGL